MEELLLGSAVKVIGFRVAGAGLPMQAADQAGFAEKTVDFPKAACLDGGT
jgi:hypothetical protein